MFSVTRAERPALASIANMGDGDDAHSQLHAWRRHHDRGLGTDRFLADGAERWVWEFSGRDNILPQSLDPERWPTARNVEIRAEATLVKLWVHTALHCRQMGSAVADMIAGDAPREAVARHGLELLPIGTNKGD